MTSNSRMGKNAIMYETMVSVRERNRYYLRDDGEKLIISSVDYALSHKLDNSYFPPGEEWRLSQIKGDESSI